MPLYLLRSKKEYPAHPAKQAVVDRFNAIYAENQGSAQQVDWAELFAELIDAYQSRAAAGSIEGEK